MALHRVELPRQSRLLFRVVALQKRLFKALADPNLISGSVDVAWVRNVWQELDAVWVRRFCQGGQETRIQAVARAAPATRRAIYEELCRQNKFKTLLDAGGDFRDLVTLPGVDAALADQVRDFFTRCYKLLSHNTSKDWPGYALGGNRTVCNRGYKDDFCTRYPASVVCPYCDGEIGTPELDHYLFKKGFPLLACSPWNLVPVCSSCNDVIRAKGDRPAITEGTPRSMDDWLHPFFRPASGAVTIKLSGDPKASIPELHSPDASELKRLENHTELIRTLSTRWTKQAASYHDKLVRDVNRVLKPSRTIDEIVREQLDAHRADRGLCASTMVKAAVCQAVLERRPEYLEEFGDANTPSLS